MITFFAVLIAIWAFATVLYKLLNAINNKLPGTTKNKPKKKPNLTERDYDYMKRTAVSISAKRHLARRRSK